MTEERLGERRQRRKREKIESLKHCDRERRRTWRERWRSQKHRRGNRPISRRRPTRKWGKPAMFIIARLE